MMLMYSRGHVAYEKYDSLGPQNKISLYQHVIYIHYYFYFFVLQISKGYYGSAGQLQA